MRRDAGLLAGAFAALAVVSGSWAQSGQPLLLPIKVTHAMTFVHTLAIHNGTHPDAQDSSLSETFDITVLRVLPQGSQIAFTLRSYSGAGDYGSSVALVEAMMNVPVEIELNRDGLPIRLLNWDQIAGRIDALIPAAQKGQYSSDDRQALVMTLMMEDLVILAAMQPRAPLAAGRTALPPSNVGHDGFSMGAVQTIDLLGVDPSRCEANLRRETVTTSGYETKRSQDLVTTAAVSTNDGWVLNLHEALTTTNFSRTTDIRRINPPPCEAAAPPGS